VDTVKKLAKRLIPWALKQAGYIYERYPAQTISVIASGIVYVAALKGIVVEKQDALTAAAYVATILIGGRIVHNKVEPVAGVRKPPKLLRN